MRNEIVILEDNAECRERMLLRLRERLPPFPIKFFTSARETIDYLREHAGSVQLIDLKCDLVPQAPDDAEPGAGQAITFLTQQSAYCPVILHSTHHDAAVAMEISLQQGGWIVQRVIPSHDLAWIDREWFAAVREGILARAKKPAAAPARPTISAETVRAAQALVAQAGGIAEARAALEHLASQGESLK